MKKNIKSTFIILGLVIVLLSGSLLYLIFGNSGWDKQITYLQSPNQLEIILSGILYNNQELRAGENYDMIYDFDNEEYKVLVEKYGIEDIAGNCSEYKKALNLMNEFSKRLYHNSNYDNHIEMNALALLEYSLDNKKQGINCRGKSQIINEMCLALGIASRKIWIMPNSVYDNECHVVNEVWDSQLNKWVMFDITSNFYWVDENGTPLSAIEIRDHIANREFCTPVTPNDDCSNLKKTLDKNYSNYLYIAKNMVYIEYMINNTVGETSDICVLLPVAFTADEGVKIISREAVEKSPY